MSDSTVLANVVDQSWMSNIQVSVLRAGVWHGRIRGKSVQHPFWVCGQCTGPLEICFVSGKRIEIPAGHGYMLPPFEVRRDSMIEDRAYTFRWCHAQFTLFNTVDIFSLVDWQPVLDQKLAKKLYSLNTKLAALHKRRTEWSLLELTAWQALSMQLLAELLSHCRVKPEFGTLLQTYQRVQPALRYMEEHLEQPIRREDLAKRVHLSPTRFNAVFRTAMGQPPLQYLSNLRIRRAQQLLATTDEGIAQIGERVGYRDPFHFSRHFKQRCGSSPAQYRKKIRSAHPH